jgi:hypothetical protein
MPGGVGGDGQLSGRPYPDLVLFVAVSILESVRSTNCADLADLGCAFSSNIFIQPNALMEMIRPSHHWSIDR